MLLPFLASNHSSAANSGGSNANAQSSNNDNLGGSATPVNEAVEISPVDAEHVITLGDGRTIPLSIAFTLKRTPTPPHIAGGKRYSGNFDKYIFL